jgi:Swiss Army Knife RNA repair-like protein
VLNCSNTPNPRNFPYIVDQRLLQRYLRLVAATRAGTVLLSTWRHDPAGLFSARHWGIPFNDIAPDLPDRSRRDEIIAWLKQHPEVTRFAVIDDEDDQLDDLPVFQPSSRTGITDDIVAGARAYLNGECNDCMRRNSVLRLFQNARSFFKRDVS